MLMELDLITQRKKLSDVYADDHVLFMSDGGAVTVGALKAKHGLGEDAEFVRKGLVASDLRFEEGEQSVVSIITSSRPDRDREIVDPKGAILDDYLKNPVVLFGHDYRSLPIGMNMWVKPDKKTNPTQLIAKTRYANHPFAKEVYQYRKDGFPLAQSIGFIPVQVTRFAEGDKTDESKAGVRLRYDKWVLLEYSDVPVPANPDAVMIAVSKGLLKETEVEEYGVDREDIILRLAEQAPSTEPTTEEVVKGDIPVVEKQLTEEQVKELLADPVEEKRADLSGQPSTSDIYCAIQRLLDISTGKTWTKWVADVYPVKYPSGHVIIADETSGEMKYFQYDYTYADSIVTLSSAFTELEQGYKPRNENGKTFIQGLMAEKEGAVTPDVITLSEEPVLVLAESKAPELTLDDVRIMTGAYMTDTLSKVFREAAETAFARAQGRA
jgi:hypothetical protein